MTVRNTLLVLPQAGAFSCVSMKLNELGLAGRSCSSTRCCNGDVGTFRRIRACDEGTSLAWNRRPATVARTSMHRILVIEDGKALQRALKRMFEMEGFLVQIAGDGLIGLEMLKASMPDVVLLDLGLPGMGGREVCREIRKASATVPILVVSAKTDVLDKVLLLELGANDYVTKPFSPRELLARVRVALRVSQSSGTTAAASFGEVHVDFEKMDVTRKGIPVAMTAQEFKVLRYFLEHPERVVSREELLNHAWGYLNYPSTRTVDNHVLKLRQKLEEDPEEPRHFKTVHNVGYKFVP